MAKGYWIARMDIRDLEKFRREYVAQNKAVFASFKGRFLVRGGKFESHEGPARTHNVVVEFDSYQSALDCYHSEAYQTLIGAKGMSSTGEIVVIEGYEGEQPI